ncbi:MAG: pyruvate dehydrogenase E2 component (dihydrolipoamide acetyltransferase) [Saprospiraceae bacterium]|jgi:pyruvate dehydrogenase E2 component (dihydrolipoamide acetyltransferase)
MEEGNIVGWMKNVGDAIESGDLLAEIETDKATMEFESLWDGHLLHIAVKEGAVPVESVIAVIGEEGEDWEAAIAAEEGDKNAASNGEAAKEEVKAPEAEVEVVAEAVPVAANDEGDRVKASPLARSMAKESGVDITKVSASGPQGRVIKKDVEDFLKNGTASAPAPATFAAPAPAAPEAATEPAASAKPSVPVFNFAGDGDAYTDEPLSQMRKVIARRLGESKFSAPHFYLTVEINMGKVMKLRTRLNEIAPTKISFNDLVVKSAAVALREHPAINSSWMGDKIRQNQNINVGVAVAVPDGLLVPVIRFADMKTLSQINVEVRHLAGKAKNKKLQPQEMSGNTFTISNLGMFGIEEFTAIINTPDSCIMAVGGIIDKAIINKKGKVKPGKMMKVTLSCDHRVVDGASGAKFLNTFKGILEDPIRLLV